jgi:hypothetical protein
MIDYRPPLGLTAFLLASAAFSENPVFAAICERLADLTLPGANSDPPGYTQPSIATFRLWRKTPDTRRNMEGKP